MSPVVLTVKLAKFEGPLDLLLHLIKVSEMNIYDIPIVAITSQYMAYLHSMQRSKLDIAGDYFVMAATLMRIKSQWLLPQEPEPAENEAEAEPEDPRAELVSQLLTYQTYKKAAANLKVQEQERQAYFSKTPSLLASAQRLPMPEQPVPLSAVTNALNQLLQRQQPEQLLVHNVQRESITVAQKISQVKQALQSNAQRRLFFTGLLPAQPSIEDTVTTFMAVLELMKSKEIFCLQTQTLAPITVSLKEEKA